MTAIFGGVLILATWAYLVEHAQRKLETGYAKRHAND